MTSTALAAPVRGNRVGMFGYYVYLGVLHLRRAPVLTALMVITLGVGVAASMATATILRAMSGDPIPSKSDRLFTPLLDLRPDDGSDPEPEPPSQLSHRDTVALKQAAKGVRQTGLYQVGPAVEGDQPGAAPIFLTGLAVHADFFAMLDVRFAAGGPWSAAEDERAANVVVFSQSAADRLFGTAASAVGRTATLEGKPFTVVGVLPDGWEPMPRFHRLIGGPGAFGDEYQIVVPFPTAIAREMRAQGQQSCFSDVQPGYKNFIESECVWMSLWVELAKPGDAAAYRDFLAGYVAEQRKLGRFPRPDNQRLYDVTSWLALQKTVPSDRRLQTYLAFGFLLVCLVNTVGLLLAKFSARNGEIGVRRALGATRSAVFAQYLIEAGVVGLAGGVVGLALTRGALWFLARQSFETKHLAHLDLTMFAATFAAALGASLLAGLLPTWRASRVTPAMQLKAQ
ncbi:MAG TPA: ABC transporter permease [Kofleriaceae bacterium]|nr:ABC transporter permease [Kofleriaceae bacterium]